MIQGVNDPRQYGGQTYGMGAHVKMFAALGISLPLKNLTYRQPMPPTKAIPKPIPDMLSSMLSPVASGKKIPENLNEWFDSVKTRRYSRMMWVRVSRVRESRGLSPKPFLNEFYETVRQQSDSTNKN